MSEPDPAFDTWLGSWLDAVAGGDLAMSQRKLSSIVQRGNLETAKAMARAKGVHLLLLRDDKGVEIVAASTQPFEVLC